jgi:hypothetical protein
MTKLTVLIDGQCAVITLEADEVEINSPEGVTFKLPEQGTAGWPGTPGNPPGHGKSPPVVPNCLVTGTTGHLCDPEGVNHPQHYNSHPCGLEVIQVTNYLGSFNLGCVFKYVVRTDSKDGLKDLKKALWYADEETRNREYWDARSTLKLNVHRWTVLRNNLEQFIKFEPDAHVRNVLGALFKMYFEDGTPEVLRKAVGFLHQERGGK